MLKQRLTGCKPPASIFPYCAPPPDLSFRLHPVDTARERAASLPPKAQPVPGNAQAKGPRGKGASGKPVAQAMAPTEKGEVTPPPNLSGHQTEGDHVLNPFRHAKWREAAWSSLNLNPWRKPRSPRCTANWAGAWWASRVMRCGYPGGASALPQCCIPF